MTVAQILKQKGNQVITTGRDASVAEVVQLLAQNKIGAIVVTNPDETVCGIVSERDIVRDLAKHGNDVMNQPVSSCMTSKVISANEADTINQIMETMSKGRFRHIPVTRDKKLIGLISIGDVVKRKIEQAEKDAEELRNYIAS